MGSMLGLMGTGSLGEAMVAESALAVVLRHWLHGLQEAPRVLAMLSLLVAAGFTRADDLGSSVQITRGGLVHNRATNTFDATVTVKNVSGNALLGPLKLVLSSATPVQVALYNSHGRTAAGADYLLLPLVDGSLAPGASSCP